MSYDCNEFPTEPPACAATLTAGYGSLTQNSTASWENCSELSKVQVRAVAVAVPCCNFNANANANANVNANLLKQLRFRSPGPDRYHHVPLCCNKFPGLHPSDWRRQMRGVCVFSTVNRVCSLVASTTTPHHNTTTTTTKYIKNGGKRESLVTNTLDCWRT